MTFADTMGDNKIIEPWPQTQCNCQPCKNLPFGDFTLVSKTSPLCDSPSCLYENTADKSQMCFCDAKLGSGWKKEEYTACDQVSLGGY